MFLTREKLHAFVAALAGDFRRPGRFYLVGETSLVFEGWRDWTDALAFTAEVAEADRAALSQAMNAWAAGTNIALLDDSPGDYIPLPQGYQKRARRLPIPPSDPPAALHFFHFDPYSVAFRFIARGDEQDYRLVLTFLERGWLTLPELESHLTALLPRFSFQTIQQDPAEFRRRYKGLLQMWQAYLAAQPQNASHP